MAVQTRGQRRREQENERLWDQMARQGADHPNVRRARRGRYRKMYKPQDTAHRHRLDDEQDKEVHVTAYSRRS